MLSEARGRRPNIGKDCFLAPNATLVGDVSIGDRCSIWYNAVLRGDVMPIRIGDETNLQDGVIVHGTYQKAAAMIGSRVSAGHGVILHGCEVGDEVLIGMGAILMDHVKVGPRCLIGAGTLLTEGTVIPEGSLVFGRPGKVVRALTAEELARVGKSADNYLFYMTWYK